MSAGFNLRYLSSIDFLVVGPTSSLLILVFELMVVVPLLSFYTRQTDLYVRFLSRDVGQSTSIRRRLAITVLGSIVGIVLMFVMKTLVGPLKKSSKVSPRAPPEIFGKRSRLSAPTRSAIWRR